MKNFIINVADQDTIDKINSGKKFTFGGIYNYPNDIKKNDRVFLRLGGDTATIKWDTGLIGLGSIAKEPYDFYNNPSSKTKYYHIDIIPNFVLPKPISKELSTSADWADKVLGVRWVDAKNPPNQAIGKIDNKGAFINVLKLTAPDVRITGEILINLNESSTDILKLNKPSIHD